jgi:hypothetical protein
VKARRATSGGSSIGAGREAADCNGDAGWRAARGDFQKGTLTAGIGAVGRGVNEYGLIVAATSAIATSATMLRNADLLEFAAIQRRLSGIYSLSAALAFPRSAGRA